VPCATDDSVTTARQVGRMRERERVRQTVREEREMAVHREQRGKTARSREMP
jgi:hypothetical protein